MNKKTRTTLQFILGGILLASFTVAGCNSDSAKTTEVKTDTTVKSMEAPAVIDTMRRDTANTRPTLPGN